MVFSQILYSATYQLWGANQIARATSTFKHPNIAKYLPYLYEKFVVFQVGKAITISLECKSHYIDCLIKELCIANSPGNLQYTPSTLTNRNFGKSYFISPSFEISTPDEELDLSSLCLIPKLHHCPYQRRSISKYSPRNLQTMCMHSINDKKYASELLFI